MQCYQFRIWLFSFTVPTLYPQTIPEENSRQGPFPPITCPITRAPQWSRAACYKGRLVQKTCAFTLWSQMSSSSFPTKDYSEISKCLDFLLIVWKNSFLYISAMWHYPPFNFPLIARGGGSHVWISHLWWSNYLLPQYFQRSHLTYFPSCILFYHRFSNLFLKPLWPHSLSLSTVC